MTITLNGTTGITAPEVTLDNTAADGGQVVLKSSGYSNWNLDNYSGRLRAYYNSTEYFTVDASGNVGVGTSSPTVKLDVAGRALFTNNGFNYVAVDSTASDSYFRLASNTAVKWYIRNNVSNSHRLEITPDAGTSTGMFLTQAGDFQMNSGYGSVATAYGCRAWVNFNGTGTVAIRASGNVSSITDNSTGNYTVNFTTAMSDANYSTVTNCMYTGNTHGVAVPCASANGSTAVSVDTFPVASTSRSDMNFVLVAVFR